MLSKTGDPLSSIPSVVFCIGPEKWLRVQAVARLKKICLTPGFEEMDLVYFEDVPQDGKLLSDAVHTAPFGSPRRLVVIEAGEDLKQKKFPWLSDYLLRPHQKVCLVFCADQLLPEISIPHQKDIVMVSCQPLKGKLLTDWIMTQGSLISASIEQAAASLLVIRIGTDLQLLSQAIEMLGLFVGSNQRVGVQDIEALISPSARETAFDILDTAAAGKPETAMTVMRQALAQGRLSIEQFMGALGWYYRMAWKARRASASGWSSPSRQAAFKKLQHWPVVRIQEALDEVLLADESLKLGCPAPELLADQLLLKLGS